MKSLIILAITVLGLSANAQSIGSIGYGGSGCPAGTLSFDYSSNNQEVVLNYDGFLSQSGFQTGKAIDRKTCGLAIPLRAPSGYQVALVTRSEGQVFITSGGKATLNLESFYAGSTGVKNSKVYSKAGLSKVVIADLGNTIAWSPCGASTNLRMNLSALTQKNASVYLDQLHFQILFKPCSL